MLATVSAVALTGYVASISVASAEDRDRPTVWIELGSQLSRLNDGFEPFSPDFTSMRTPDFSPSQKFEKPPLYGLDGYGKVSFEPANSGWVLSAAIRYGRSSINRHVRQQNAFEEPRYYYLYASNPSLIHATRQAKSARFADTTARNSEQHAIADFQAGKDVGLGLFGGRGTSVVNMGVRFAQFTDKSNVSLKSDPDWRFQLKNFYFYSYKLHGLAQPYHSNAAGFVADRSFRGLGLELSWNASLPVAGHDDSAELDFDWGVNAALLFGRQKARTQHHETVRYNDGAYGTYIDNFFGYNPALVTVYRHTPPARTRSRSAIVPNIGGFAGLSFKYDAAKVSFGYKADFFFGAMDGGIDARKTYGRDFYGPFASISIGFRNGP